MSFFDSIYDYLVSFDNDCIKKNQKEEMLSGFLKIFPNKKDGMIHNFLKKNKNDLLSRESVKEIGITMLLDYENKLELSVFYDDIIKSKNYNLFKKYIYYPTLN